MQTKVAEEVCHKDDLRTKEQKYRPNMLNNMFYAADDGYCFVVSDFFIVNNLSAINKR